MTLVDMKWRRDSCNKPVMYTDNILLNFGQNQKLGRGSFYLLYSFRRRLTFSNIKVLTMLSTIVNSIGVNGKEVSDSIYETFLPYFSKHYYAKKIKFSGIIKLI